MIKPRGGSFWVDPIVKVGFTGTQRGMTQAQKRTVQWLLSQFRDQGAIEFHHGDCIGADDESHDIAELVGLDITIHPPTNPAKRAFRNAKVIMPEADYLVRNHNIVDGTDVLIATPKSAVEEFRGSGTWATWRYATKVGRSRVFVRPNGLWKFY